MCITLKAENREQPGASQINPSQGSPSIRGHQIMNRFYFCHDNAVCCPLDNLPLKPPKYKTHLVLRPEPNDPAENSCPHCIPGSISVCILGMGTRALRMQNGKLSEISGLPMRMLRLKQYENENIFQIIPS